MIRFTLCVFLLLFVVAASGQSDQQAIKKCFDGYRSAILEDRGEDAVKFVDANTIAFYQKSIDLALTGDSTTVAELPLIEKLTVLSSRHRVPKDELTAMNGNSYFVYAVKHGMVGKNSVMGVEIGEVKVDGDTGKGQMVSRGQATPLSFGFAKESGTWKLDLTSIFPMTNEALANSLTAQGVSDNDFIFKALEAVTGKEVTNDIWKPMK